MIFLVAVFFAFVIYGLVSALFPSVWPQMAIEIGVDYTLIGILIVVINIGSGLSSAFSYVVRRKLGTSRSIVLSLSMFVISLLLFLNAKNLVIICFALAFLGIGNGIIDTVINSYVIKAYDSGKISLLHASWGIGSSAGPVLMSLALTNTNNYKNGFLWVVIVLVFVIALFIALKAYWEEKKKTLDKDFVALHSVSEEEKQSKSSLLDILKIKNGLTFVSCFDVMGATNTILSAWMATLAVGQRGLSIAEGATAATCYFIGLTVTRILLSITAKKIGNHRVIYGGIIASIIGYVMLFIMNESIYYMYVVAFVIGVGIAPAVPFLHSSVKEVFSEEYIGVVVSACNSTSLIAGAIISMFTTFFAQMVGINNIQVLFIILMVIGCILYTRIIKNKEAA